MPHKRDPYRYMQSISVRSVLVGFKLKKIRTDDIVGTEGYFQCIPNVEFVKRRSFSGIFCAPFGGLLTCERVLIIVPEETKNRREKKRERK